MPCVHIQRAVLASVLLIVGLLFSGADRASAQDMDTIIHVDTFLIVDVADTLGSPGHAVPVSVFLQNLSDSISAYQVSITLSRPDLMEFTADTTIDTCYTCIDSACTIIDTSLCTLELVPSSVQGTLAENWDLTSATTLGGLNIQLLGIADIDADEFPLPILPYASGVLVKVIGRVNCGVEDTVLDRTIGLNLNSVGTFFSTKGALTIPSSDTTYWDYDTVLVIVEEGTVFDSLVIYKPVAKLVGGSITVPFTVKGDLNHDGVFNVLDVVMMVGTAFRGSDYPCPPSVGDVNCDGVINVFDVVLLVNHVFRGGPQPIC
ncbi:MAG TPA: hypothetical protein VM118_02530 [Acidobacteriota bacterium]|nr:hypothetical protein [Acidobacteriota bacterium]